MRRQIGSLRRSILEVILASALLPGLAHAADLTLDAPFGDQAVLQRGQKIDVHGTASAGARVTVSLGNITGTGTADQQGNWHVALPAHDAASDLDLVVHSGGQEVAAHDLAVGDVYLCSGQSNMEFPVSATGWASDREDASADATIRLLPIARARSLVPLEQFADTPRWVTASGHSASFSAVCLFFGRQVALHEKVPVGLIGSYWGGTPIEAWLDRDGLAATRLMAPQVAMIDAFRADPAAAEARYGPELDQLRKPEDHAPRLNYTNLYNAMIAPLGDYGLAGVLWYQGENNANHGGTTATYRAKLAALLGSWRRQFDRPALPFAIIQLSAFGPRPGPTFDDAWPQVRQAQRLVAANDPHAGLVVTMDVGERLSIHPPLKLPVAERAFAVMQRLVYGKTDVPTGPVAVSARHAGDDVLIDVSGAAGALQAISWGRPGPFQLCAGDSCQFVDGHFANGGIAVTVPQGFTPDKVRYCWGGYPQCNVFDAKLLPLGPFVLPVADASR